MPKPTYDYLLDQLLLHKHSLSDLPDLTGFLKLDQSTPQTITGGKPIFNSGLVSNGDIIIKAGQKVVFDG
jgi:hypothetical protein